MIAVIKAGVADIQIENLINWLETQNLNVHISKGHYQTVLGLVGDTTKVDIELLQNLEIVDSVTRITDPFKSANRKFHPEDSIIKVGDTSVGGDIFAVMAGPCSVESEEQVLEIARAVKASGATMLTTARTVKGIMDGAGT